MYLTFCQVWFYLIQSWILSVQIRNTWKSINDKPLSGHWNNNNTVWLLFSGLFIQHTWRLRLRSQLVYINLHVRCSPIIGSLSGSHKRYSDCSTLCINQLTNQLRHSRRNNNSIATPKRLPEVQLLTALCFYSVWCFLQGFGDGHRIYIFMKKQNVCSRGLVTVYICVLKGNDLIQIYCGVQCPKALLRWPWFKSLNLWTLHDKWLVYFHT